MTIVVFSGTEAWSYSSSRTWTDRRTVFKHYTQTYTDTDRQTYRHWHAVFTIHFEHVMLTSQINNSYEVTLAMWDHTVLPATWHKWTHPALTTARHASTQLTYPKGMEGWVDLGDWLHTEMVYPPQTVTHPSTNPAVHGWELNSRHVDHKSDAPNHYTTKLRAVNTKV